MKGRASAIAFVAGAALVQTMSGLPTPWMMAAWLAPLLLAGAVLVRTRGWRAVLAYGLPLLALWLGVASASLRASWRLADALPHEEETQVTRVEMLVTGLPQGDENGLRFEAKVLQAMPDRAPERIEVAWYPPGRHSPYGARRAAPGQALPDVRPGQVWRAALVMRRPHGPLNPHGFDYEGWMFQRGVRALGSVRGEPELLDDRPWSGFGVAVQRARHVLRERMREALDGQRYGPVLIALALGDQAGVDARDWQVFNRTGITHLVSISGMHVTMVAAMLGLAVLHGWRRVSWRGVALAERAPAQIAGALAAMLCAGAYCLIAGWGVPARRTFFMLAVAAMAVILRLPCSPSRVLAAAAFVVVAIDPWATVSVGFWLSFGAVTALMAAGSALAQRTDQEEGKGPDPGADHAAGRQAGQRIAGMPAAAPDSAPRRAEKIAHSAESSLSGVRWRPWLMARARAAWRALKLATHMQLVITLVLIPPLAFLFQQVSLSTPFANAIAIPVVSFAVTPLALLSALFAAVPGGQWLAVQAAIAGHALFDAMMVPIVWLAEAPWSMLHVAAAPWPWLALALAGTAIALLPRGWPARHAGWLLLLPALGWRPSPPAPGEWRWTALDVGQGMAVVVETASSVLLYDTGLRHGPASDAGARVIVPFLRGQGVRRIDVLVVSHADLDHAGGVYSVLQALPAARSYASFSLDAWLDREAGLLGAAAGDEPVRPAEMLRCQAGLAWESDGVAFEFLHPPAGHTGRGGNADSCVLRVRGLHHTALLTGDIGVAQERALASADDLRADIVMMPHHGSRSSSSEALVRASEARHAVAQMGRHNRYGHPAPEVVRRWERAGAQIWRSDRDGAVMAASDKDGLRVSAWRRVHGRYWHERQADTGMIDTGPIRDNEPIQFSQARRPAG